MLQDTQTIRFYQQLTDALVFMWDRGYRYDELRLYIDGYIAALRHSNALEMYLIHDQILVGDLQIEDLFDAIQHFNDRHRVQAKIVPQVVRRLDRACITLEILRQRLNDLVGNVCGSGHARVPSCLV